MLANHTVSSFAGLVVLLYLSPASPRAIFPNRFGPPSNFLVADSFACTELYRAYATGSLAQDSSERKSPPTIKLILTHPRCLQGFAQFSGALLLHLIFMTNGHNQPLLDILDPGVLAALPLNIRAEVLSHYALPRPFQLPSPDINEVAQRDHVTLPLPTRGSPVSRLPRYTFYGKFWKEDDLRITVRRWIKDFGEKGPCKEDLGSFIEYLGKVVKDEKDLDKAVKVMIWLQRIVDEFADEDERFAKHTWKQSSVTVTVHAVHTVGPCTPWHTSKMRL
ncbi:impB/mucB/samB family protein [Paraphaeosphaeria sporulosa]